ncbi:MAG: glycosyltransferase [Alphaproteobacteria bacterium]|nr:MAG: glycosyltransferase [Alphaproteobacteria bacterium]
MFSGSFDSEDAGLSLKMRIVQVVPRIFEESSGTTHSVPGLAAALDAAGEDVQLLVLDPLPVRDVFRYTRSFSCLRGGTMRRIGCSPAMKTALRQLAHESDVIHTNSLWMMPNIYPAAAVRRTECKLVISPRGTLSPWALSQSRWVKRLVGLWGQWAALRAADCIHVTSEEEMEQARGYGLRNPIAVVPNGIDCPDVIPPSNRTGLRRLLFLGRIHPTKSLDLLVSAWSQIEREFLDWELVIAGPLDSDYSRFVRRMVATEKTGRIRFIGEVKGQQKSQCFADSDVFVLPSKSENFGMAVAEALAHGVPAIVSQGAPWSGLDSHACGWWFRLDCSELVATLRDALSHSREELAVMGQRGRDWMEREYSWAVIARRMQNVYRWLCGMADRPEWVYL